MGELVFKNGQKVQTNTLAIKYCDFGKVDNDWLKKFALWTIYLQLISSGTKPQQVTVPFAIEYLLTYLGSIKFNNTNIHLWFTVDNKEDLNVLDKAIIIMSNDIHQIEKTLIIEGKFSYEV